MEGKMSSMFFGRHYTNVRQKPMIIRVQLLECREEKMTTRD